MTLSCILPNRLWYEEGKGGKGKGLYRRYSYTKVVIFDQHYPGAIQLSRYVQDIVDSVVSHLNEGRIYRDLQF